MMDYKGRKKPGITSEYTFFEEPYSASRKVAKPLDRMEVNPTLAKMAAMIDLCRPNPKDWVRQTKGVFFQLGEGVSDATVKLWLRPILMAASEATRHTYNKTLFSRLGMDKQTPEEQSAKFGKDEFRAMLSFPGDDIALVMKTVAPFRQGLIHVHIGNTKGDTLSDDDQKKLAQLMTLPGQFYIITTADKPFNQASELGRLISEKCDYFKLQQDPPAPSLKSPSPS